MTEEAPKGLPAPGSTTTTRRTKAPITDALSVEEAAEAYGLSISTIYRRLHREEVPGQQKVMTPQGPAWRIPRGALDALGYNLVERDKAPEQVPTQPHVTEALDEVIGRLTTVIESSQRQIQAAEADRGEAVKRQVELEVSTARAEAKLELVEEQVAELKAEVERLRKRRRWFARGGD